MINHLVNPSFVINHEVLGLNTSHLRVFSEAGAPCCAVPQQARHPGASRGR